MNTDYQRDAAMAVIFKEEVDKALSRESHCDPCIAAIAIVVRGVLDRLARRYCDTQLRGMTQHAFLQLCGLAP